MIWPLYLTRSWLGMCCIGAMPSMVSCLSSVPSSRLNISVAALLFGCAVCNDVVAGSSEGCNALGQVVDSEDAGCVVCLDGSIALEMFEKFVIFFDFYGRFLFGWHLG